MTIIKMENTNKEYTEKVLPFIIEQYNLHNPNPIEPKFNEIIDYIGKVEEAASENNDVASQIMFIYHAVNLN